MYDQAHMYHKNNNHFNDKKEFLGLDGDKMQFGWNKSHDDQELL